MPTQPRSPAHRVLLVLATTADQLDRHAGTFAELQRAGHTVRLAYLDGEPGPGTRAVRQQRRIRAANTGADATGPTQRAVGAVRRHVLRGAEKLGTPGRRLLLAAKFDPWFQRAVRSSDLVLLLEGTEPVRAVIDGLSTRPRTFGGPDAAAVLREQVKWDHLASEVARATTGSAHGGSATAGVLTALRAFDDDDDGGDDDDRVRLPPLSHEVSLLALGERLMRRGRYAPLLDLVTAVERVGTIDLVASGLAAVRAYAELALLGTRPADLADLTRSTLRASDAALARDDLDHAALLAAVALALHFHRDLHFDVSHTPLVDEPSAFLAPLRDSRVMRVLTSATRRSPAEPAAVPPTDDPRPAQPARVVLLPGAYGRFATPLIDALASDPRTTVSVLDLSGRSNTFRFLVMDADQVLGRLRHALGHGVRGDGEDLRLVDRADVVFADWADKGAVWASMVVPEGARLVIRVHGVDALAPWIHLVDWSRVDDLIVVSPHMADLVRRLLGERLDRTRLHVVPNQVDVARFTEPTREDAGHVLCMVGWGKRVKDPLWSVEVLAELLRQDGPDSDWRLLLVGADFPDVPLRTTKGYASAFRARVGRDDVRGHIDYVGETADVPRHLRRAGFILSSSVRESFHLAVLEGVAAGAVPVVRDWPVFAGQGGARRLYPQDWVVRTPQEAAARIRGLADPVARSRAAADARAELSGRFSAERVAGRLLQIVLAPDPSQAPGAPAERP